MSNYLIDNVDDIAAYPIGRALKGHVVALILQLGQPP